MATLEDCVKFAAYHKANQTRADASSSLRKVILRLDYMRTLGNGIIADFEQKKNSFDAQNRKEWEDQQATKIIAVFEDLAEPLAKLADEERLAHGW